jgi:hypothetical protein
MARGVLAGDTAKALELSMSILGPSLRDIKRLSKEIAKSGIKLHLAQEMVAQMWGYRSFRDARQALSGDVKRRFIRPLVLRVAPGGIREEGFLRAMLTNPVFTSGTYSSIGICMAEPIACCSLSHQECFPCK